jgi:hypothetical protein
MFEFLNNPLVTLTPENPKWVSGRELTLLTLKIVGFCHVSLSSNSHPNWKSVSVRSFSQTNISFIAPINAEIIINTWSFRGKFKSIFVVGDANWNINPPLLTPIKNNPNINISHAINNINIQRNEFLNRFKFDRPNTSKFKILLRKINYPGVIPKFKFIHNKIIRNRQFTQ